MRTVPQVEQLNLFFNEHGFRFVLAGITKTTSPILYTNLIGNGGAREYPAKVKTHKGWWESLNVWVTGEEWITSLPQLLHADCLHACIGGEETCMHEESSCNCCAGALADPAVVGNDLEDTIAGFARFPYDPATLVSIPSIHLYMLCLAEPTHRASARWLPLHAGLSRTPFAALNHIPSILVRRVHT